MLIQEIGYRPATDEWSQPAVFEAPADVDETTVLSFLTQRYGTAQADVAWTSTDRHERVEIGWTFRVGSDDDPSHEIVAIPLLHADPEPMPLFVAMADQRAEFERLAAEGLLDELQIIDIEHVEWRPDQADG